MISYEQYWVPPKAERKEWMTKILDKVSRYYGGKAIQDRRYQYYRNQQRIRGDIATADYEYIWKTWGLPKPMSFINYPLLETHIDGLVGAFVSTPMIYDVWKVNENAVSAKVDMKTKIVFSELAEPYWKKIEETMGVNLPIEDRIAALPEGVKKYKNYDVRDMLEDAVFYSLYDLITRYGIQAQIGNTLNDLCENGFGFGKICYDGNNPYIRQIPICNSICDVPMTSEPYNDTAKHNLLGEDHFMNFEEVCDNYGWCLGSDGLEKLQTSMNTFYSNSQSSTFNQDQFFFVDTFSNEVYVRITDIQVRAMANKKFIGKAKEEDGEDPAYIEKPIREVHCGIKIGRDIYRTWRKKNQITDKDNYTDLQMDYFGVFTKSNLYRKGWGFQMLYNVINMHIEFLVNQTGGKATTFNMQNAPEGFEVDDIVYAGKVQGVIPEQPQPGSTGSAVGREIDFGLGVGFQYLLEAKREIESSMGKLTGVSPERLGQGSEYASAKLNEQQAVSSTFVTAPIYHALTKFTEMGLQRMSDIVKFTWARDEDKAVVVGDMGLHVFKLTQDLSNYDYGIYAKNSMQDVMNKKQAVSMMQTVLATNPDFIKETIQVINSLSGKEAQKIIENAVDFMRSQKAAMEKSQIQVQEMMAKTQQEKMANDKLKAEASRYTPIDVEQLKQKGETMSKLLQGIYDEKQMMQEHGNNLDASMMQHMSQADMTQMQPPQQPAQ